MPRFKVSVFWEGENSTIDDFEDEKEAESYGYDCLADGCASCTVYVESVDDDDNIIDDDDDDDDDDIE